MLGPRVSCGVSWLCLWLAASTNLPPSTSSKCPGSPSKSLEAFTA